MLYYIYQINYRMKKGSQCKRGNRILPYQSSYNHFKDQMSEEEDNFNSRHHECENGKSAVIWISQVNIYDIIKTLRYRVP